MATGKQLSDGNPDGVTVGQSSTDKVAFYGATPVTKYTFASALATTTPISVAGSAAFCFASSALMNAAIALLSDLRAWAVQQGFGA